MEWLVDDGVLSVIRWPFPTPRNCGGLSLFFVLSARRCSVCVCVCVRVLLFVVCCFFVMIVCSLIRRPIFQTNNTLSAVCVRLLECMLLVVVVCCCSSLVSSCSLKLRRRSRNLVIASN